MRQGNSAHHAGGSAARANFAVQQTTVSAGVTIKSDAVQTCPCIYRKALRNREGKAYNPETGFTRLHDDTTQNQAIIKVKPFTGSDEVSSDTRKYFHEKFPETSSPVCKGALREVQ